MFFVKEALCTTVFLALGVVVVYYFYLKSFRASKKIRSVKPPDEETWIGKGAAFFVFAAICDTFLPSLTLNECCSERITEELAAIDPNFLLHPNVLSPDDIAKLNTFLCAGAIECGTHKNCLLALERTATKMEKRLLSIVLTLLSTSAGCFILTGYPLAFQDLPLWAREQSLRSLRDSRIIPLRTLYHAFKRLIIGVYFSFAEPGTVNPSWDALDYKPVSAIKPINQLETSELETNAFLREMVSFDHAFGELRGTTLNGEAVVKVDVVVVGSGCGGGVVAHQLVEAGFTVLVLEKGGFYQTDDFAKWKECDAFANAFDKGGLCTSEDGSIVVLAGSCVGGGSTINWSASFVPPKHVLEDWSGMGLKEFSLENGRFQKSLETVLTMFNVNSDNSFYEEKSDETFEVNLNNKLLWKSSQLLGFTPEKIPRNVKSCVDCGHCTHGCSHKAKQSSWNALLEPIILNQSKSAANPNFEKRGKLFIVPNCFVEKVLFDDQQSKKKGTGVVGHVKAKDGSTQRIRVTSKVVVSACGSIHTPALLLRSGCKHPLIGKYLSLHPVIGTGGMMGKDKNTGLASGVSMGVVVKQPSIFSKRDGDTPTNYQPERFPVAIENPPVHMGILGLILPWNNGLQLKIVSLAWKQFATYLGISRDKSSITNRVDIDCDGNPVIHYAIADHDKPNLLAGLVAQLRFHRAAGAKAIFYGHSRSTWFVSSDEENSDERFASYLSQVQQQGVQPLDMQVFSAHQMSSCRMGCDSSMGPVSPEGSLYEVDNVFVADGSVLPTSLGINPMITIFAFAHMISSHIIEKLERTDE